jgi:heterodisulfide reductase subunit A-like polyferredoxin
MLDSRIPEGPLAEKWSKHKDNIRLVNPANKRLIDIVVVGTGLAGASAAASLAEMGYNVKSFCFQDSQLQHKAGSTQLKIIKTTEIQFTVYSTILLKEEITDRVRLTFTVLRK